MITRIEKSRAVGTVTAPPSKSMAHRLLICGALSSGSTIENVAFSKDIEATLSCLKALGASVEINGNTVKIGGLTSQNIADGTVLDCFESGSTLRFLLPICLLSNRRVTLKGAKRLFERPLSVYEEICKNNGFEFLKADDSVTVCGKLKNGKYAVRGDISSQFITGLLYALSCVKGESYIEIIGKSESTSYIDMTLKAMEYFGVEIKRNANGYQIMPDNTYKSQTMSVEGDYSNAAFLLGLNMLGGEVEVLGLSDDTTQGDRVCVDIYRDMCEGKREFDLSDCPDLAPVLFSIAAVKGGAIFSGTRRLAIKESNRATAMQSELSKLGIKVDVEENRVTVHGGELKPPTEPICGHNDHRIVMALTLLCTLTGGEIKGSEAVAKSYPDFFEVISSLGIGITHYEA